MAPHLPGTILVIDDEPSVIRALTGLLRRDGYLVGTASNGRHAMVQLQEQPYDVIVCDLHMPDLDGPAFYALLTCEYPALCQRVIFLTGDTRGVASRTFLTQCGRPWLSDSNRTILAAKELRHIAQTLVRHLINHRFDVTLY